MAAVSFCNSSSSTFFNRLSLTKKNLHLHFSLLDCPSSAVTPPTATFNTSAVYEAVRLHVSVLLCVAARKLTSGHLVCLLAALSALMQL